MATVDILPPDPAHTPAAETPRGILYPLWAFAIAIKPYPGAIPRTVHFSVDGVRSIPLPIKGLPETVRQEVPAGVRLLAAVPREDAEEIVRDTVKKALGFVGGRLARLSVTEHRCVYKILWMVDDENGAQVRDSRSGTVIPMPGDMGATEA